MQVDISRRQQTIMEFVREHGRNGIPLYVMYPGDLQSEPVMLPQLLTRNIVSEALDRVRR